MNADIKAQWIAALRSGEYAQGQYRLRQGDRFCCLGVLCELAVRDGVTVGVPGPGDTYDYDGQEVHLPASIQHWAGIRENPMVTVDRPWVSRRSLAELNDDGMPFEEIADLIEGQL